MSFQDEIKKLRELAIINEDVKKVLERMTGKELVSYEGIDALVGALMTHYNGELKKKAQASHSHSWSEVTGKPSSFPANSHTHDDRYYTKADIDDKFTKYCPYKIGDIYITTNSSNPSSVYLGTTWQKIPTGKYIKTGDTALQTGGSNSITITKNNLPNIKLKIDSFSITVPPHSHDIQRSEWNGDKWWNIPVQADERGNGGFTHTELNAGQNTGTASPYTETLGNSNPIAIQPEYITLNFWKRIS